jgi:hypothetical protein
VNKKKSNNYRRPSYRTRLTWEEFRELGPPPRVITGLVDWWCWPYRDGVYSTAPKAPPGEVARASAAFFAAVEWLRRAHITVEAPSWSRTPGWVSP